MIIAAKYSFNGGENAIRTRHPSLLNEIEEVIRAVDASLLKTKISEEITMEGDMLYAPTGLNKEFKRLFEERGWRNRRVACEYSTNYYVEGYNPAKLRKGAFRDMDFLKEKVGVEVQFGKYSFMVYNVCAKMTIFKKLGHIDIGVEIVPMKRLVDEMSSGVSYFEQFAWDLDQRGVADIDIPVLIIGIDATN